MRDVRGGCGRNRGRRAPDGALRLISEAVSAVASGRSRAIVVNGEDEGGVAAVASA
ncbi:hypothetical protein [Streptomyces sp. NPDC101166]|uniref:hypothetical protein n=1 Tax=Streptomyces sp. NPDC101166 TaxID=3366120 RepID=UPI0037FF0694